MDIAELGPWAASRYLLGAEVLSVIHCRGAGRYSQTGGAPWGGTWCWGNRHLNLDRGVPGQHVQDPDSLNSTPVGPSVVRAEVLHDHCEGQVVRLVSDGHAAVPPFFLFSFGLHNLATHCAILSSAPVFVMPLVRLLILTPDMQRAPHGARHRAGARQRPTAWEAEKEKG